MKLAFPQSIFGDEQYAQGFARLIGYFLRWARFGHEFSTLSLVSGRYKVNTVGRKTKTSVNPTSFAQPT
jgi:hypothetical protein